jgi:hypothetical protein
VVSTADLNRLGVTQRMIVRWPRRGHGAHEAQVEQDGIPVTTPAQTIVDLADVLIERSVEQALAGVVARLASAHHVVHGREVDAYWPDHRLVVEVDSWKYHADPSSFGEDRAKDALLISHGERVLRVTRDHDPLHAIAGALNSASPAAVRA